MTIPQTKVELGLTLAGISEPAFKLDSSIDGILGQDKIAGLQFFDVTNFVRSVVVVRGRSNELDYFQSGSATVNFDNRLREFDPSNIDSSYYPEIRPRRLIRISANGFPIFYGFIKDWDIEYDISENHTAVAYCSDMFSALANMTLAAVTPSAQSTGARVNYILDRPEVNYLGGRNIDTGSSTLGAYAIPADTNVLNYLRQIERSEVGEFFVSSSGDMIFKDRNNIPNQPIIFADDGTGIPYSSLRNQYGDELLYNYVNLKSPAGSVVVSDTSSILNYQISTLTWDDLLNNSTSQLSDIANFLLKKFSAPQVRFTGMNIELSGLERLEIESILNLDLFSRINLVKNFDTGNPSSVTQLSFVSGISHRIVPGSHQVSFNLEVVGSTDLLILGDALYGKLDEYALSF